MTDSLKLLITEFTQFAGGSVDYPRWAELAYPQDDNETRTADEIISSIKDGLNGGKE